MRLLSRYAGAVSWERDALFSPSNRVQAGASEGLQEVVTGVIEAGQELGRDIRSLVKRQRESLAQKFLRP